MGFKQAFTIMPARKIRSSNKHSPPGTKTALYQALLLSYQLYKPQDLLLLKEDVFLKLCAIQDIAFLSQLAWLPKELILKPSPVIWPSQFQVPLNFKENSYGDMLFYSSKKISKRKQAFLKKISAFIATSLYFISAKEKRGRLKKQWQDTFDSFPQAFCITDPQHKILHCNQAFQKLFQKKAPALLGQRLFQSFPNNFTKDFTGPVQQALHKKREPSILQDIEGKNHWELSSRPLYLQKEQSLVWLFLIKDISKELQLSSQIANKKRLREMGWIKGSLAHELNNPITGIQLLLAVLEKEIPKPHLQKDLAEMQKAVHSGHQMIQRLLSVSKSEIS